MKDNKVILSQEEFENKYDIATNFLEYGAVTTIIREFLKNKELPLHGLSLPYNSYINIVISLDRKGVSNIYKMMIGRDKQIIEKAVNPYCAIMLDGGLSLILNRFFATNYVALLWGCQGGVTLSCHKRQNYNQNI